MRIIAGALIVFATSTLLATNNAPTKTNSAFAGNSISTVDGKMSGTLSFFKTFVNDSQSTASEFTGLNNANFFYAKDLGSNAKVQINSQYGPISVVDPKAQTDNNLKLTEVFVTYSNAAKDMQVKVGKFFSSFGSYNPYRADKTLIEEQLSNLNNNSAEVSYLASPNLYLKVWGTKPSQTNEYYGAKLGYSFNKAGVNIRPDVSYINDARALFANNAAVVKSKAYQAQIIACYGPVEVAGKVLRAPNLIQGQVATPSMYGLTAKYDTNFSGKDAQIIVEYERFKNTNPVNAADKRVAIFLSTKLDSKLEMIGGVSERTFNNNRNIRTSSLGLQANI